MMLLTKELEGRFLEVGDQSEEQNPILIAHFFNPSGVGDWYATEYDDETQTFYGYVSIHKDWNDEWWYFSLQELKWYVGPFGLGIERDRHRTEIRFMELKKYWDG